MEESPFKNLNSILIHKVVYENLHWIFIGQFHLLFSNGLENSATALEWLQENQLLSKGPFSNNIVLSVQLSTFFHEQFPSCKVQT